MVTVQFPKVAEAVQPSKADAGTYATPSNGFTTFTNDYRGLYFRINGEGLYSRGPNVESKYLYDIVKLGDDYYFRDYLLAQILNIIEGKYTVIKTDNQFLIGDIDFTRVNLDYTYIKENVFTSLTTSYQKLYIQKLSEPSKQFVFYDNNVYNTGVYRIEKDMGANPEEVLKFFGYEGKFNVEIDDMNKIIILNLNQ